MVFSICFFAGHWLDGRSSSFFSPRRPPRRRNFPIKRQIYGRKTRSCDFDHKHSGLRFSVASRLRLFAQFDGFTKKNLFWCQILSKNKNFSSIFRCLVNTRLAFVDVCESWLKTFLRCHFHVIAKTSREINWRVMWQTSEEGEATGSASSIGCRVRWISILFLLFVGFYFWTPKAMETPFARCQNQH